MTDAAKPEPGCLAFLAAPVAAALAACLPIALSLAGDSAGFSDLAALAGATFLVALVVAGLHTFFLAVPLYYWLERRFRPTLAIILVAGALIGALPAVLLTILDGGSGDSLQGIAAFSLFGVSGGLAFWAVLRLDRR